MADPSKRLRGPDGRMVRMAPEHYTCVECGSLFPHKRSGRTKHLYCSRKCAGVARGRRVIANRKPEPDPPMALCQVCQTPYRQAAKRRTCGQRACQLKLGRSDARARRGTRLCRVCGISYVATVCGQGYCSPSCSRQAKAAQRRAYRKVWGKTHRKRARRYGCHVEAVNPLTVFARDDWHCYLCGCETPRALRGTNHDNAPELDHVVPLSRGGAHASDNVRCACRVCNLLKGDALLDEVAAAYGWGGRGVKTLAMSKD